MILSVSLSEEANLLSLLRLLLLIASVTSVVLFPQSTGADSDTPRVKPDTRTSLFKERWLDAVVSIERTQNDKQSTPIGTGFLFQTPNNHVVLVTAKHVVTRNDNDKVTPLENLGFLLNRPASGTVVIRDTDLQAAGLGTWFLSTDHDIALRFISWPKNIQIVSIPMAAIMEAEKLDAGAPLLILGFPLGNRTKDHAQAIARRGMVARSDSDSIIADVFVFPGNSGGPAVYVPIVKVGGPIVSPLVNEEKLVGVVSSYIPYREPAISLQTKRPRIVFEENSGLANVVPIKALLDLLSRSEVVELDESLTKRETDG